MDEQRTGGFQQLVDALFHDLPREIDRVFRTFEFRVNRLYVQPDSVQPGDAVKPVMRKSHPTLWFGVLALLLLFFGPTFASLCTTLGPAGFNGLMLAAIALPTIGLVTRLPALYRWWRRLPDRADIPARMRLRRVLLQIALGVGVTLPVMIILITLWSIAISDPDPSYGLCVQRGAYVATATLHTLTLLVFAAALFAHGYFGHPLHQRPVWRVVIIFALAAGLQWLMAGSVAGIAESREALQAPYFHVFTFIVLILLLVAWMATGFAHKLFAPLRRDSQGQLATLVRYTELFSKPQPLSSTDIHITYAILSGLFSHTGFLLLPPSVVALVVPANWVLRAFVYVILVAALLMVWSKISDRWNTMLLMIRRWFFTGWPAAISYFVIAVGLTRLAGISYVTTVVDGAPLGFIPMSIALSYSSFWFFEYWINRPVSMQYLQLMGASADTDQMDYTYCGHPVDTAVLCEQRWMQAHGAGRIAVVGYYPKDRQHKLAWHTYNHYEFVQRLKNSVEQLCILPASDANAADAPAPADPAPTDPALAQLPTALVTDSAAAASTDNFADAAALQMVLTNRTGLIDSLDDLYRRTVIYFNLVNFTIGLLIAALAIAAINFHRGPVASPTLLADTDERGFVLSEALAGHCVDAAANCNSLIAIAASGGGTRAALHTVAALRGLAAEKRIQDVKLVSGVSGGGASLAYFAAHHRTLGSGFAGQSWQCFETAMASPFIERVVESAAELRKIRRKSQAYTLAEAMDDAFFGTACMANSVTADNAVHSLDGVREMGIILNSTITGHPASAGFFSRLFFADQGEPTSEYAGGRMAFTNLRELAAFPRVNAGINAGFDLYQSEPAMPYTLVRAEHVSLAQTAALTANFPPVFANSLVRITSAGEPAALNYFVTDGGVAENRGLLSLIYAFRSAIARLPTNAPDTQRYPDIDIIIADAGANNLRYSADRGIGAAISGGPQKLLASALMLELLVDLARDYNALTGAKVRLNFRPMPYILRANGGIATNWMLPESVLLTSPFVGDKDRSHKPIRVSRAAAQCIIRGSYDPGVTGCMDSLDTGERSLLRTWLRADQAALEAGDLLLPRYANGD